MRLSPLNIKKQDFSRKVKGYDTHEVAAFLERVADEIEQLQKENEDLKKALDEAGTKISEFKKIEKSLQETLFKAQETSARSMESAKKQTALILKEAEIKANQIIERAKINANEIKTAVQDLKEEKDIMIAKLKAIVNSQINIIEKTLLDKEEVKTPEDVQDKKPVQTSLEIDINEIINKISE